jgi:hypothetical protein
MNKIVVKIAYLVIQFPIFSSNFSRSVYY